MVTYYNFYPGLRESNLLIHVPFSSRSIPFSVTALLSEETDDNETLISDNLQIGVDQLAKVIADKLPVKPHRFVNRLSAAVFNPLTGKSALVFNDEAAKESLISDFIKPYELALGEAETKASASSGGKEITLTLTSYQAKEGEDAAPFLVTVKDLDDVPLFVSKLVEDGAKVTEDKTLNKHQVTLSVDSSLITLDSAFAWAIGIDAVAVRIANSLN